ncbi:CLAVATA3/ESR (CLE)-related protein 25-like [Humulus lupulus]|uniref:CLAVATA3/ESR (CLE)-related protein 25-like n=1 Tax=Humulus lupulus TaxID=3486 RepID=UPI002B411D00|nr:CLAVATA3/ESR (CLE)-related protein 25-like [Humulus lupulus]
MGSSSSSSSSTTDTSSSSSSIFHLLKLLVRGLAVVGLMWILLAGTPEGTAGTTPNTKSNLAPTESAGKITGKDQVVVEGEEKLVHPKLDLINYMSKRRVPNGPDPIHNRRAGKSGRPPGQA